MRLYRLINFMIPILALQLIGCGGGSGGGSSSPPPVACGNGTNNNGSNVCTIDNALTLINPPNTFWSCNFPGYNGFTQAFILVPVTTTSGTGTFAPWTSTTVSELQAFTWQLISPNQLSFTLTSGPSLAPFLNLNSILPNSIPNATEFTSSPEGIGCTLMSGAIGPQASAVHTI